MNPPFLAAAPGLDERLTGLEQLLQVSPAEMAQLLGVHPRTLTRWRAEVSYPQHEARARLAALDALARHLMDTFERETDVQAWMTASSRTLGGFTPKEALLAGRGDRVEAALEALDSGVFV